MFYLWKYSKYNHNSKPAASFWSKKKKISHKKVPWSSHSRFVSPCRPLALSLYTYSPHCQPCAAASLHIPMAIYQNQNCIICLVQQKRTNFHFGISRHRTPRALTPIQSDTGEQWLSNLGGGSQERILASGKKGTTEKVWGQQKENV